MEYTTPHLILSLLPYCRAVRSSSTGRIGISKATHPVKALTRSIRTSAVVAVAAALSFATRSSPPLFCVSVTRNIRSNDEEWGRSGIAVTVIL
ncbi:hypothetical protein ABZP36_034240 [Zizania latifolia]